MPKDQNLTRRNRLAGFNYANPGYYFLTACSAERLPLFSKIEDGIIHLVPIGTLLESVITSSFLNFPNLTLDEYVIMPNHVHLLVYVDLANEHVSASSLMKTIKGASMASVRKAGLLPSGMRTIWQKGFHDEIIRNDAHLERVRAYIQDNPRKWAEDEYF